MHFSKTYTELLLSLPPELRSNAIEYRKLKKLINQVVQELTALGTLNYCLLFYWLTDIAFDGNIRTSTGCSASSPPTVQHYKCIGEGQGKSSRDR